MFVGRGACWELEFMDRVDQTYLCYSICKLVVPSPALFVTKEAPAPLKLSTLKSFLCCKFYYFILFLQSVGTKDLLNKHLISSDFTQLFIIYAEKMKLCFLLFRFTLCEEMIMEYKVH